MSHDSEPTRAPRGALRQRHPHRRPPLRSRAERGQSLAELAFILPIFLLLVLGVLETGRLIETQHVMSSLTREGANLASRGTSMAETLELTEDSAQASLGSMGDDICIIVTEIEGTGGSPEVVRQEPGGSCADASSKVGGAYGDAGLLDGHTYFVVEAFVNYQPFSFDFNLLIPGFIPETLYDRSLF